MYLISPLMASMTAKQNNLFPTGYSKTHRSYGSSWKIRGQWKGLFSQGLSRRLLSIQLLAKKALPPKSLLKKKQRSRLLVPPIKAKENNTFLLMNKCRMSQKIFQSKKMIIRYCFIQYINLLLIFYLQNKPFFPFLGTVEAGRERGGRINRYPPFDSFWNLLSYSLVKLYWLYPLLCSYREQSNWWRYEYLYRTKYWGWGLCRTIVPPKKIKIGWHHSFCSW